jgi:hypothetical protein
MEASGLHYAFRAHAVRMQTGITYVDASPPGANNDRMNG